MEEPEKAEAGERQHADGDSDAEDKGRTAPVGKSTGEVVERNAEQGGDRHEHGGFGHGEAKALEHEDGIERGEGGDSEGEEEPAGEEESEGGGEDGAEAFEVGEMEVAEAGGDGAGEGLDAAQDAGELVSRERWDGDVEGTTGDGKAPSADEESRRDEGGGEDHTELGMEQAGAGHSEDRADGVEGLQPADALAPFGGWGELDDEEAGDGVGGSGAKADKEGAEQPEARALEQGEAEKAGGEDEEAAEEDGAIVLGAVGDPSPEGREEGAAVLRGDGGADLRGGAAAVGDDEGDQDDGGAGGESSEDGVGEVPGFDPTSEAAGGNDGGGSGDGAGCGRGQTDLRWGLSLRCRCAEMAVAACFRTWMQGGVRSVCRGGAAMDYPREDRFSRRVMSSSEKETVHCP
jgi:hypothetical protein